MNDSPVLLHRIEDAARILGIGRSNLYKLMDSGEVESIKIGKSRRITQAALERYVARLEARSAGAA